MTISLSTSLAQSFRANQAVIHQFYATPDYLETTIKMAEAMATLFEKGKKMMVCGNGGSACQAMHFA